MEYVLATNNLEKKYKNFKAISNLNIHIEKGSIYGIIGRNGAGKTTLIRIICGLQKPTNGTYSIYSISNESRQIIEARKRVGVMIETPSIYLDMTAIDNLKEQYKIIGLPSLDGLYEILKFVGLNKTKKKKAKDFSLRNETEIGISNDISRES